MAELRVLLTVSGSIPDDLDEAVASGVRPRADYRVIAERLDADVADVRVAESSLGWFGRGLNRLAGAGPLLAWYCWRHRAEYDVVLTDGEQVGLPLALLERLSPWTRQRLTHVMIVHVLSTRVKRVVTRLCRLAPLIDRFVVYASQQRDVIVDEFGVPGDRVVLTPFMVDTDFFRAAVPAVEAGRVVCSAGLERRDYPTLLDAVVGLDAEVVIAAASPWSKRSDSSAGRTIPGNVRIERLSLLELRSLFDRSAVVVMPLDPVDFQAGITTILEAMSMGRPVVCSQTAGQTDTIEDGETGVYVPTGDADRLREAIAALLDDAERRRRLGNAARSWAEDHADIDRYADLLADVVRGAGRSGSRGR